MSGKVRISVLLDREVLMAVEEWRRRQETIPSRSTAVNSLLRERLGQLGLLPTKG